MISPVFYLYRVVLALVMGCTWLELKILNLLLPHIHPTGKGLAESVGVILHCPGDFPWTPEEEERVRAKLSRRYKSLIHLKVNDETFFPRMVCQGSPALAEGYVDKIWEFLEEENLTELVRRFVESGLRDMLWNPLSRIQEWLELKLSEFNFQTRRDTAEYPQRQLGLDWFGGMLDPRLQYSCGYWARASTLEEAQLHKMDLIGRKLDLQPGMRVLDIGCGWGTLCKYLAEQYQVECVGVTLSEEEAAYGRKICQGLPVLIELMDYRKLDPQEAFDRVVSVEMIEQVGGHNYREFFGVAHRCLREDGLFLLQTVRVNHKNSLPTKPLIFPNQRLPRTTDITKAIFDKFVIEDWHSFGLDYAKTLRCWRENFSKGWPKIAERYGERLYRMLTFYLGSAEGLFFARRVQLWQIVLSKDGLKREYRAAR